ncbi:TonB-dependent receptor [Phenylobacterium sp.]|uniref:TonB-dependent receptor n=1 Tax=Phenylobacterium sp. TaxID=1871053 RepID=UPI002737E8E9|nr:TonB-dependent receptor [Phenylobacterium sp.]MDP3867554.1 TonB-dependent receptor [Phenylobacterium sp.]
MALEASGNHVRARLKVGSALALVLTLAAGTARAQDVAVEEVIVTATKREQALIDVPLAVTAIGGAQVKASGVRDLRDMVALAPSLNAQTPGGDSDSSLRIRGIGTISTNPGLESAVGVVIDGVVRARTGVAMSELGDVDRIEVLRGPQGTLYGSNTSAGLVNIVTPGPNMDGFEGYAEGTYGNYNWLRAAAGVTGPIGDGVGGRLEAIVQRRDGLLDEVNSGDDINRMERVFLRAKVRIDASETVRVNLIADYTYRDEDCCAAVLSFGGPVLARVQGLAAGKGYLNNGSLDPYDREAATTPGRINQEQVRDFGFSAQADWDLGFGQLVSITAYRKWKASRGQDFDHSGVDLGYIPKDGLRQGFSQVTQELRLQGDTERVDWLVGAFLSHQDIFQDFAYQMGASYADFFGGAAALKPATLAAWKPGDGARGISEQESNDFAVFTHNTLRLTDKLSLTGGLRYTINEKSVAVTSIAYNPACDAALAGADATGIAAFCLFFWDTRINTSAGPATDSRTEKALSGTAVADYAFTDHAKAYLSYSRGYKSGGYNMDRAGFSTPATPKGSDLAFGSETTDAYEAGLKLELFENRLRINTAVFHQIVEGFQLVEFTGVAFRVRRLAEALTTGAEIEATWRPTAALTLSSGLTYTDARYAIDPGNVAFSGKSLEQAPDWVSVSSFNYRVPLGGSGMTASLYADARYVSSQYLAAFDPLRVQKGYTLVNARLSLATAEERWRVEFWARNLFDTEYARRKIPATFQGGSYSAFLGDPRTFGVTLRANF